MRKQFLTLFLTTLGFLSLEVQQSDFKNFENLFTPPKNYVVPYQVSRLLLMET